ncbi:TRAP transporter substrate-binding protein [Skermanella rosea]|uniref:TRAP transporter substrate-binding protein n=1 Tax=Skermanella rosea TaxID=1817965 RepID=UPI001E5F953C|nr:TRAP transporter substrate-binding protein [Skermanella rosea]UEM02968.1 TRAP transporter substrate-binding protein [Skermanella rosea]
MRRLMTAAVAAASLAASFMVSGAMSTAAWAQTKWDLPTAYPDSNFHTQTLRWFADEVRRATDGQLDITLHSNASLFKMPEIKRAVQTGQVPAGEILLSAYGNEDPLFEADAIPFLAAGYPAARKLYEVQKPLLEKRLADQGIRLLYSVAWPGQGIYTKREIAKVGDFRGIKFRAYNAATARLAELLGAAPTTVQQAEVPQAFATGVVDAMITSGATGVDTKAWEFSKFYYDTSAMHPRNIVMVGERAWRRLPEEVRTSVLEIAAKAEARGWAESERIAEETKKTMGQNGLTIVTPSEALMGDVRAVGRTMVDEWVKKAGADGQKIADALK